MIVCSCNILSDAQVKLAIAGATSRPRPSRVYASLGCAAQCGRCSRTIRSMIEEIRSYVAPERRAIEALAAI